MTDKKPKSPLVDTGQLKRAAVVVGRFFTANEIQEEKAKKTPIIVPAGNTILFTDGGYSSYGIIAVAKACKELDLCALRKEWDAERKGDIAVSPFVLWLCLKHMIEEMIYFEALADDGDFDVYPRGVD